MVKTTPKYQFEDLLVDDFRSQFFVPPKSELIRLAKEKGLLLKGKPELI